MVDVPWPVIYEAPFPTLALGDRTFDIRHRAVVMGTLDALADLDVAASRAERLVAEGAVALDLGTFDDAKQMVAALRAVGGRVAVPLCVGATGAGDIDAALSAGAAAWSDNAGAAGPDDLARLARAGASLLMPMASCLAGEAGGAGLAVERVVIDADMELLRRDHRRAVPASPLCLTVPRTSGLGQGGAIAVVTLGISLGVRLIRTADVRGARRTADVMAAVLEAREPVPR